MQEDGWVWVGLPKNIVKYMTERIAGKIISKSVVQDRIVLELTIRQPADTLIDFYKTGFDSLYGYAIYDYPLTLEVEANPDWLGKTVYLDHDGKNQALIPYEKAGKTYVMVNCAPDKGDISIGLTPVGVITGDRSKNEMSIKMYPNPFSTSVDIRVAIAYSKFKTSNLKFKICNINGKLVYSKLVNRNSSLIWEPQNQPAGIYMIEVKAGLQTFRKRVTLLK
jgi:hypothetical protein